MDDASSVTVCNRGNDLLEFVPCVALPHTTMRHQMICPIIIHLDVLDWLTPNLL